MAIRIFTWKNKFIRKKRSTKPNGHGTMFNNADKHYTYWFRRSDRNNNKLYTKLYTKGFITEEELENNVPRQHRHSATWEYW